MSQFLHQHYSQGRIIDAPISKRTANNQTRDFTEAFPRFVYVGTEPSRRIVKVGMSRYPATRLIEYRVGDRLNVYTDNRNRFFLLWSCALGTVLRSEAIASERELQSLVCAASQSWQGEWFRIAASRAVAIADSWATARQFSATHAPADTVNKSITRFGS